MSASIFISGDIMNTCRSSSFISHELKKIILSQDFAICNFEAPVEGVGYKIMKAGPNHNQKEETIRLLKNDGFDLILLANNHIYDYGEEALAYTLKVASKQKMLTIGAGLSKKDVYKPLVKEINGTKIGIINACEAQFGVLDYISSNQESGYAWINHPQIEDAIRTTKKDVDKVIVCAHAGLEDYPVPISEWKNTYKRLCDMGADCIVASHPHVPQGYEIYHDKPIFYSLGNFYFDTSSFEKSADYSFSVLLELTKEQIQFKLIYHHKENGIVGLSDKHKSPIDIDDLNNQLSNTKILDQVYLDAYHNITLPFFSSVFNSLQYSGSIFQFFKRFVKLFLYSKKFKRKRELLLLHLLRNETYRWVTQKAVQLKSLQKINDN
jgi:poly-gamma-glutamate capsule biosynthesis protein CapA/YwtB (metallophosphatase superfamily)